MNILHVVIATHPHSTNDILIKCFLCFSKSKLVWCPDPKTSTHHSFPHFLPPFLFPPLSLTGVVNVFSGVMKSATSVLLKIDEVGPMDSAGDMAYERSHYTFYDKDGNVFDHGK